MAKAKVVYVCSECGYETAKWMGKCPSCNAWSTLQEEARVEASTSSRTPSALYSPATAKTLSEIDYLSEPRYVIGLRELDRVLGGGIVKGSVVLLSGDPGIGKSTILLQVCKAIADKLNVLYVSGEESAVQIKMRAERIGVKGDNIKIMTSTDAQAVCEYINSEKPDLVMIDSIQTMTLSELSSSAGSIVQVRECTNMFLRTGKTLEIPIFIVSHVNKGGEIAGPKVMEHIVDTVLYFEGERNQSYRILRAIKNRFGSTNEIGVFEMQERGLIEVENPSAQLLSGRMVNVSGGCITCIMEGTRPILSEVQALVTTTGFGNPRRTSTGFDYNRLSLILAVLEKRLGLYFSNLDAYLNIVGGMRIDEPAADLAVALALVSGIKDISIDEKVIAFGEIGLSGEVRSTSRANTRVLEAARLGFTKCILPKASIKQISDCPASIELIGVTNLRQAIAAVIKP